MPCRNDYLRMVKLNVQRNIKEKYSYRANDFEIGIKAKQDDNTRSQYIAIFDMNDLLCAIKQGGILNCLCVDKKHRMSEYLNK